MAVVLTPEQIRALAPDAGSAKSGNDLADARKWVTLGFDDRAAWGECQGSGATPYQTKIDLDEPAFQCSCPSRKFPCKHALGLFLLRAGQESAFTERTAPAWVVDWLAGRDKRSERKAQVAETNAAKAPDPEKGARAADRQAQSAASRLKKVTAGMDELGLWMRDVARRGLGALREESYAFWEGPAARMVDAQAPGVARLLRELAGLPATGDGWQGRLLERLGRLHLLVEGFKRIDTLPLETQADIRSLIGWTQSQEELLGTAGIRDRWLVLGQRLEEDGSIRTQRRWLWGEQTGRPALVLHFAHSSQPLDTSLVPGTVLDAELVFFPGSVPLRALIKTRNGTPGSVERFPGHRTIDGALSGYAAALALNPWLDRFPFLLCEVVPARRNESWMVRDAAGRELPLDPRFDREWTLLAISGGHPVSLFGEWDGVYLIPWSTCVDGRYHPLS
jgi:hypothetical protein